MDREFGSDDRDKKTIEMTVTSDELAGEKILELSAEDAPEFSEKK